LFNTPDPRKIEVFLHFPLYRRCPDPLSLTTTAALRTVDASAAPKIHSGEQNTKENYGS